MALKDLVINSRDLQEETIEKVVIKYFAYDDTGAVLIKNKDFWKLNGENKILRYLAAISGRQFLELQEPEVSLNNAQISKGLNININSVRGFLSNLRSQGFIETEGGKNKITTQGLHDLLEGRRDSDGS
ncbi:MAG: hypothetical protein UU21_C0002G0002 [Candidatus Levybacteria bacterium GW2011_GWA2_40_8]|nr:MAG: hypothetical protein UU21_C0002G0002 [Candidatus Levybacteria bacterium GW2011_GWA2_40_8]